MSTTPPHPARRRGSPSLAFIWPIALVSSLVSLVAAAQTYELVHAFRNSGQPSGLVQSNGEPYGGTQSGLIQANDGYLYGTSYWGGTNGVGTIFRIDSAGSLTTVHSFTYADGANPAAGLVQATDGNLYGTATRGGASNLGTVFRMDPTGAVTRVHSFDGANGKDPRSALIQASDGNLYGTAYSGGAHGHGTVYKVDLSGIYTALHGFDGGVGGDSPAAALLQAADGNFYGTTEGGWTSWGTVFKMDSSGTLTTIHAFNALDGYRPFAALLQASDGNLYGTTMGGGANEAGTVFRIDSSGIFAVLHSFDSSTEGARPYSPLIQAADGNFYGTTSRGDGEYRGGTVYRISAPGEFTLLHRFEGVDGTSPQTALVQADDGNFYGTTTTAAFCVLNQCSLVPGTAFRMDLSGELTTLYRFGWTDGDDPTAALTQAMDGNLYGTTYSGGASNQGTIFRWEPSGNITTLHDFDGSNGAYPGRLIQASDGDFYGTCQGGGNGNGSFFKMDATGQVATLHVFDGVVNGFPSDLIHGIDGYFYGTTIGGGDGGWGTVFRLNSSGDFTQLWSFDPSVDGAFPSDLIQAPNGAFYGTTISGGENGGVGIVFAMDSSGSVLRLHTFQGPDGYYPTAPPIFVGELFGTTTEGGELGFGTVFKCSPYIDDLYTIHSFNGDDGSEPGAALVWTDNFHFCGTTPYGGANWKGTVFKMDYDGNFTNVHSFSGIDGGWPTAALIQASDGFVYGTAGGGPFGAGVIFRLSTATIAVNEVTPTSGPVSGGVALDLLGGGFTASATVTVGGVAGTDVTVLDPTFLYLLTPALSPGTLNDVSVTNPGSSSSPSTATRQNAFFADFLDVSQLNMFHDFVEKIFRKGITAGCAAGSYCPDTSVTRAQMAVFLLKSEHGSAYVPPSCTGIFGDVPCPSLFADWIEQLAAEGITAGCGRGNFCPGSPVTRAQMAVFLQKTEHGPGYQPPPCTGLFPDVPCPSLFADWIEQLAAEEVTVGCGGGNYCPGNPNTRAQMAAFLVKTFHM